jgi:hypothetical protein
MAQVIRENLPSDVALAMARTLIWAGAKYNDPVKLRKGKDLEARALDAISKGLEELPPVYRRAVQLDLFPH